MRHSLRHALPSGSPGIHSETPVAWEEGPCVPGKNGTAAQKRLQILDDAEIEAFYGRPRFTPDERLAHFALSIPEQESLQLFRSVPSQVYFILQLGFFKAKNLFFSFTFADVDEDVAWILARHFPQVQSLDPQALTKPTILKHRTVILTLIRYHLCSAADRQELAARARQAAQLSSKPYYVLRELVRHLDEQRIVAPGYTIVQMIVGQALTYDQDRLRTILRTELTAADCSALDGLFDDTDGLYTVTLLKREPKDFSLKQMRQEISHASTLRPLYTIAMRIVPKLGISNEGIKYYASLVGYYSVFRLRQLETWMIYLYLLCFVIHRYQRLHDRLLTCLIHTVSEYDTEAKAKAKELVSAQRLERNADLPKAGDVLKLFTTSAAEPVTAFQTVQAQAFAILGRDRLARVADYIAGQGDLDEKALYWQHVDSMARRFKPRLRPLIQAIDFAASNPSSVLLQTIAVLSVTFGAGRALSQVSPDNLPSRFIPVRLKRYLYGPGEDEARQLLLDRYEFLVYLLIRNRLEAGDVFCRDSVRFRSLEDDLIDDQQWQSKEALIAASGSSLLTKDINDHMADLERQLEERIAAVNARIAAGENTHFQLKKHGQRTRWTLQYPRSDEEVNHAVFDTLRQVEIGSVLAFANQECGFLSCLEHVLGRYSKQALDDQVISACLVAWGTNMGLGRMGDISDISYQTLSRMSENFLRPETLKAANDCVSNAINKLPMMRYYNIGDTVHSSSDGQKFETALSTFNARHSPKYFGLEKGIVALTLLGNYIPVTAQIIGAHEHESHFVYDLLFNNTTDIQPTIHSTDTHGTNEVNFALLHMFNYTFAPRYKAIHEKVRTALYGFRHPTQYRELLIRPIRKIQRELIVEEWDNVQRIFASLARKTTTQSIIVGKLNAYARRNKTRRALWEYDNIIRSIYLLDYIDLPPLRQNVQRALNRGENYHQLRRAVSYANFGKLRFRTEEEQLLWSESSRLITNCIIYYNTIILSRLLAYKEAAGDTEGAEMLKQVSPIAWQHINLYGRYEFTKRPAPIDLETIVEVLAQNPIVAMETEGEATDISTVDLNDTV
jgi:TnpA family transposase